jgi:replication factor A1
MLIKDLEAKKGFDVIEADVISVAEARQVKGGSLTIADAQIKDASGTVKLTLWNEDAGKVKVGDKIKVSKGWVSEFQGAISISTGKFGQLEVLSSSEKVNEVVKEAIDDDII